VPEITTIQARGGAKCIVDHPTKILGGPWPDGPPGLRCSAPHAWPHVAANFILRNVLLFTISNTGLSPGPLSSDGRALGRLGPYRLTTVDPVTGLYLRWW